MGTSRSKEKILDEFIPVKDLQKIILEYNVKLPYLKELKNKKRVEYKKTDLCLMREINVNYQRIYFIIQKMPSVSSFWKERHTEADRILYMVATRDLNRIVREHWIYYKKEEVVPDNYVV